MVVRNDDNGLGVHLPRRDPVDHRNGVGRRGSVVLEDLPDLAGIGRAIDPQTTIQVRAERVERELERRGDPEVPAGAAQTPEQVRLLGLAGPDEPPICCHELDRSQAVDRQPEMALESTGAAAEGQPGDPGMADHADRADEPVRLRCDVEFAEEGAAVRRGQARRRIDRYAAHPGHVDDEPAVAARMTGGAMATGADSQGEVVLTGEPDRGRDIRARGGPDDDRRSTVEHGVPQAAGVVVGRIGRRHDVPAERFAKTSRLLAGQPRRRLDHSGCLLVQGHGTHRGARRGGPLPP